MVLIAANLALRQAAAEGVQATSLWKELSHNVSNSALRAIAIDTYGGLLNTSWEVDRQAAVFCGK